MNSALRRFILLSLLLLILCSAAGGAGDADAEWPLKLQKQLDYYPLNISYAAAPNQMKEQVPALLHIMREDETPVAGRAALVLGTVKDTRAVPMFRLLPKIGEKDVLPYLEHYMIMDKYNWHNWEYDLRDLAREAWEDVAGIKQPHPEHTGSRYLMHMWAEL
ncbi:MAG: hypothetical protein QGD94_08670 [Planctomycetia bacterium]|nr:hypothetical protein [Planctomycetia bacterium]